MTQSEMKVAVSRLFSMGKEIFSRLSQKDTMVVNEEKYQIDADFAAEPFQVHIKFTIYPENGIITLFSVLPFDVPVTKSHEFAVTVCNLNYDKMYAGNFDYSSERGKVVYRLALLFRNSVLSSELVEECVKTTIETVSQYNEMLFKAACN